MLKRVKTTVLLTDYAEVNRIYAGFFSTPFPARACYEVEALPKGAKVEIEAASPRTDSDEHCHQRNAPEQWRVTAPD